MQKMAKIVVGNGVRKLTCLFIDENRCITCKVFKIFNVQSFGVVCWKICCESSNKL